MRWGKPTKNKKRRDPRYFLHEQSEDPPRDLSPTGTPWRDDPKLKWFNDAADGSIIYVSGPGGHVDVPSWEKIGHNQFTSMKDTVTWDNGDILHAMDDLIKNGYKFKIGPNPNDALKFPGPGL
jgi:hypothetical protein